ncbi:hypothetical protein HK100_006696 [Physocladia obscura]|uniref:TauD/TfdA-like domain-containing protein n=1 Tax=Physocladia obscura TaxID=109957 RepID=A0AAD5X8N6_9FUNG|nr:hypothetical protein HK100_006696 [Physocladia obscura]
MPPTEIDQASAAVSALSLKDQVLQKQPLTRNYSLDALYKNVKIQPHIGSEFEKGSLIIRDKFYPRIQIRDILKAENADELIFDFAVLVSERNVVFLRDQDVTFEEQKNFVDRLGRAAGKPATSKLHTHPLTERFSELGDEALIITSKFAGEYANYSDRGELHSNGWHTDITFEPVPSDYAALIIREAPVEGGDTLWASSYEIYERLSPAFRTFLEGLTATHFAENFIKLEQLGFAKINEGPRGAPEDLGKGLTAVHPVIRTNPVTGWKGIFVNKGFTKRINELSKDESDIVLEHLFNLTTQNHDLQVRFRWNKNDVAVWDNRSALHTATTDFNTDEFIRFGQRATSLGERPYFDPKSTSRREALGIAPPVSRRAHLATLAKA